MKTKDIRLMHDEEIRAKVLDARQEYMNLRFQITTGQQTDTSRLKAMRRLIAQYETILHERELTVLQEGEK